MVLAVAAKLAAVVLVFDTAGLDAFDLPKSLVSRVFGSALAGLLVAALLRYGTQIVPRTRLHAFVAAFVLANVISAVFAENTYVALFGERDRYLGLTFVGDMLVLYLAVAVALRAPRDWEILLTGVGSAGAASLAYGVLQFAGLDPISWQLNTQGRPFGTFGHPDMFGHFLSVAFGVALGMAVAAAPRDLSRRIAAVCAALLALAGIAIVATRASALGVAAAVVVLPVVALRLHAVRRADLLRSAGVGAVVIAAMIALVLVSPLGSRLRATVQGYAVEDRLVIYENAVSAFRDRPLVGWGPDGFAVAYPHYQQARENALHGINTINTSAHDWALETAATTGVLGLGTLLALIGAAIVTLWRSGLERMPAVAAPLLVGGAAYWASGLVSPNALGVDWFAWVVFGTAAAVSGTRVPEETDDRRVGRPGYLVAYAAAAAGLILAYPVFSANREALAAQVSLSGGNAAAAIQKAEAAVASDSGRARYWSILGAADQMALRWRAAADAHTDATRRAPYVASYWVNVASSRAGQAVSGDDVPSARAAAFEASRRAISVSPNEPVPHATLARVAAQFGDQDLANAEITRAIALYQGEPDFDRIGTAIAAQSKDAKLAIAFLQGLLAYKDSATLRIGIAQAALRAGDRAAALDNARRAVELDPANSEARALLASLSG